MVKVKTILLLSSIVVFSCEDAQENSNTFESLKNDMLLRSGALCELKPDSGPCRAAIPRFYFDQKVLRIVPEELSVLDKYFPFSGFLAN